MFLFLWKSKQKHMLERTYSILLYQNIWNNVKSYNIKSNQIIWNQMKSNQIISNQIISNQIIWNQIIYIQISVKTYIPKQTYQNIVYDILTWGRVSKAELKTYLYYVFVQEKQWYLSITFWAFIYTNVLINIYI